MKYISFPLAIFFSICALSAQEKNVPVTKTVPVEVSKTPDYETFNAPFMPTSKKFSKESIKLLGDTSFFAEVEIMGKPCIMLVDTGASHTVFDYSFVKTNFPETQFGSSLSDGRGNVTGALPVFDVEKLTIGGNEFCGFKSVSLDLTPLKRAIPSIKNLNGVLGMNILTQAPLLICNKARTMKWLSADDVAALTEKVEIPVAMDPLSGCFSLILTSANGNRLYALLDCGANTSTFQPNFWVGAKKEKVAMITTTVHKNAVREEVVFGVPAELKFGEKFSLQGVEPMLAEPTQQHPNIVGSDILSRFDILIDRKNGKVYAIPQKTNK